MLSGYKTLFGFLLLGCIGQCTAQNNQPKVVTPLTEEQSLNIAKDFSHQIGHPIVEKNVLGANDPSVSKDITPSTAQRDQTPSTWKYRLFDGNNQIDIEIIAATGMISQYFVHSDTPNPQPEDGPLSKAQAIAQATTILTKAGAFRTNELKFKEADQTHSSATTEEWYVSWDRTFQGVPYRDQGASVTLDADTGKLIGFGVRFRTAAPESSVANITRKEAQNISTKQLISAGLEPGDPSNLEWEVIQPNNFWHPDADNPPTPPRVRVAWICQYKIDGRFYEVWVDRETGQVIGGSQVSNAGYLRRVRPKIAPQKRSFLDGWLNRAHLYDFPDLGTTMAKL